LSATHPPQARLDRAASRDKSHGEAKASEAALKALIRTQRAEEARKARIAAEEARSEKLASLSARVEESVERKSKLVAATQAKNAYLVKRALAVVAAHKEQQREASQASALMLETKCCAAAERRHASFGCRTTSASRAEVVKAAVEATKLEQALRTKRALEAAAERREEALSRRIDKARDELSRVQAASESKEAAKAAQLAATRRSHFAKRNDAEVAKHFARLRPTPPVAFEITVGDGPPARTLPAALIIRLQIKTRRSPMAPATDLDTRKSITAGARVAFARKDLAAVEAALAATKAKAAALKTATEAAGRRGAAIARSAILARAAKAKATNALVDRAAIRRGASRAAKSTRLGRKALCAQAASGRRAAGLVARAAKAGTKERAAAFKAKREAMDAARAERGHALHRRTLAAHAAAATLLARKASAATTRRKNLPSDERRAAKAESAAKPSCSVA